MRKASAIEVLQDPTKLDIGHWETEDTVVIELTPGSRYPHYNGITSGTTVSRFLVANLTYSPARAFNAYCKAASRRDGT